MLTPNREAPFAPVVLELLWPVEPLVLDLALCWKAENVFSPESAALIANTMPCAQWLPCLHWIQKGRL